MQNDNVQEYKSENPLVQKCLDILGKPGVTVTKDANVLVVRLNGEERFDIGYPVGPLFIKGHKFYDIDKEDIKMLVEKSCNIMKNLEKGYYQDALEWLDREPEKQPVVPQKIPFMQKVKDFLQKQK